MRIRWTLAELMSAMAFVAVVVCCIAQGYRMLGESYALIGGVVASLVLFWFHTVLYRETGNVKKGIAAVVTSGALIIVLFPWAFSEQIRMRVEMRNEDLTVQARVDRAVATAKQLIASDKRFAGAEIDYSYGSGGGVRVSGQIADASAIPELRLGIRAACKELPVDGLSWDVMSGPQQSAPQGRP